MSILDSPFLNPTVIDKLLVASPSPEERVKLLSAKLHLINSAPSIRGTEGVQHSAQGNTNTTLLQLQTHIDLARALQEATPPRLVEAEATLSVGYGLVRKLLRSKRKDSVGRAAAGATPTDEGTTNIMGGEMAEMRELERLRTAIVAMLMEVEMGLGRVGRANKWRALLADAGSQGQQTTLAS